MRFFPSRHLLSSFSSLIAASAVSISSSFMIYTETIDKHDYNKTIDKHDYVIISGKRQGQLALEAEKEVLKRVKRGTKVLILTEDEIHNDEMNIQLSHSRGILRKVQRFYRKDTGEADIELSWGWMSTMAVILAEGHVLGYLVSNHIRFSNFFLNL